MYNPVLNTRVTRLQKDALNLLVHGPLDTFEVAKLRGSNYNSAHHILRRLEDKTLIRRINLQGDQNVWELTATGRRALND